jgi:hypothetical protein
MKLGESVMTEESTKSKRKHAPSESVKPKLEVVATEQLEKRRRSSAVYVVTFLALRVPVRSVSSRSA